MKLNLYDKDLNRIAIIGERYVSCLWSEGYNSIGAFTLELNAIDEYKKKIKEDFYVGRSDRKTLMIIKAVEINNGKIIASGKTATRILDDIAFVGTIKSGAQIDKAVYDAYNKSTKYKNVSIRVGDLGIKYEHDISNKSFLELCEIMCTETDTGFSMDRNGKNIEVVFYKPAMRGNLIFSEKYGNLSIDSISISNENYKNYAIILGQGENENRLRVDVDRTNGEDRKELLIDARDLQQEENENLEQYMKRLENRGVEELIDRQKIFSCAFTPYSKDFGTKYDLGDILTVYLTEYDLKLRARVTKFTQKAQDNKTETTIAVGNIALKRGK